MMYQPWFKNSKANCLICPSCCSSGNHRLQDHHVKTRVVKEKKVHAELKRRYEEAKAKEKTLEEEVKSLDEKFQEIRLGIKTLLDQSFQGLENLQEIALKPIMLSMPEDQELRILTGKQELKVVQFVRDMRRLVESLQKLSSGI